MSWTVTTGRSSGRFVPIDAGDQEFLVNTFACDGELHSFAIVCPGCGAAHAIKAGDARPRVIDRQKQRFRCSRCRLAARVRITIDCAYRSEEPEQRIAP